MKAFYRKLIAYSNVFNYFQCSGSAQLSIHDDDDDDDDDEYAGGDDDDDDDDVDVDDNGGKLSKVNSLKQIQKLQLL